MILETALVCLALNIYHEARGEDFAAQANVASVTLNRVEDDRFPSTVCAVVKQHKQFSWYSDGRPDEPNDQAAWKVARTIARLALEGGLVDQTGGAIYYHTPEVSPSWAKRVTFTTFDGAHLFYKEN